jgi:GWxTD domain-containing protein
MNRLLYIFGVWTLLVGCKSTQPAGESTERPKKTAKSSTAAAPTKEEAQIAGVKSKFLGKDSTYITVFMNVELTRSAASALSLKDFSKKYAINYVIYPDFASRERLGYGNVPLDNLQNITAVDPFHLLVKFDVKKPLNQTTGVMLIEIAEIGTSKKVLNDLSVRFKAVKLSDRFALFDKSGSTIQMRNYVTVNDTFMLSDVYGTNKKLFVSRYQHDFDAATSPMNTVPRNATKTLTIDSTFLLSTGQPLVIRDEGLYFFLEDTTDAYGIGVVVANKRFPKMTRPEELARPVMYVSQNQEIMELMNSKEAKKSLDKYWLTLMSGNSDVAKQSIRAYYSRVEEANRLFTSYKEGWKTDKGMIFIVMGPPDRVQRGKDREVWVYSQRANFSEINFTFNRRPNQFVEDHYELQRYVEYQPIWYPIVEAWRAGGVR